MLHLLILIVSIILNLFFLLIIKSGLTGKSLNTKLSNLLENKIYLFFTVPFFISLLILIYLNNSVIFLEDKDIVVTTVVQNDKFQFSPKVGATFNLIFNNLGSAAVFSAGARIAADLVSKHSIHLLPKTGIIGGIAAGFTATFRVTNYTFPVPKPGNSSIETGEVPVKLEGLTMSKPNSKNTETISILQKYFGNPNMHTSNIKTRGIDNKSEVITSPAQSTSVIAELDREFPNWKNGCINSPLEYGDLDSSIKLFLIETLTNNLILQFIIIYLMIMLIIIFTCKLIIDNDIQLNKLKEYPLGNYIYYVLTRYILFWKTSANVWIYLLSICIIIFSLGSLYSIYQVISFLN